MTTSGGGGGGGGGGGMKKGPWSAAEDAVLVEYVTKNGEGNWNAVQRNTGLLRCGKSCRLRWANHLRPNLKKGAFSPDEERLIIDLHSKLGNKWARISSHLPGRTDNEIKNYWNTRVKRRLRQGLPLYPNQNNSISTQTSKMPPSFPQPTSLPLSFHKNTPNNNNNNNFSLFNPISLPSSFFPLHHTPLFVSPHIQRRDLSTFSSHHVVSTSSLPMGGTLQLSSGGGYGSGFGFGFGFESSQVPMTRCGFEGFNFDSPRNFELPSNQHDQNQTYDHVVVSEVKDNNSDSNVDQTKSGLLDDMLQEAQVKVTGRGVKRERDDCGLDWDDPTSENSFTGIKKDELEGGQQSNSGKEDLSNLLDLIPSLVEVPDWCNDGGSDSPADQSTSNVSIEIHNDDKTKQQPPLSTTVMSTSDYEDNGDDWNNNNYSWDNLPRIY